MVERGFDSGQGHDDPATVEHPDDPSGHRMLLLGNRVSLLANLSAAGVSFLFLAVATSIFLEVGTLADELGTFSPTFLLALPETIIVSPIVASVGSALFLLIAIGLQLWELRSPFDARWPFFLSFPLVWAILLPEALLRGGSIWFWVILGATVALAFCVHWLAILRMRERLD